MPLPFLHNAFGAYDLSAIMCPVWTRARAELVICIHPHILATLQGKLAKATKGAALCCVPHHQFSAIGPQNRTTLQTLDGLVRAETVAPC